MLTPKSAIIRFTTNLSEHVKCRAGYGGWPMPAKNRVSWYPMMPDSFDLADSYKLVTRLVIKEAFYQILHWHMHGSQKQRDIVIYQEAHLNLGGTFQEILHIKC